MHDVFESELTIEVITDLTCGEELLERIERCDHYTEKDAAQAVQTILLALQVILVPFMLQGFFNIHNRIILLDY